MYTDVKPIWLILATLLFCVALPTMHCVRRIIKASDDLRINPESAKGIVNNINKIHFIREQIEKIKYVEQVFKNSAQK